MGLTALRKIQLGRESSAGTPVAATTIWRGPAAAIENPVELTLPSENVGYMVQTDRGYFSTASAQIDFPETEATYEQILHPFEAGIHTEASITANGGTSNAYIYNYLPSTTAQATLKNYSIQAGDNQQAYVMEYGYVKTLNLTGAPNEAVKITSSWGGRQRTKVSFTGALTPPTVEEILFNKGKLYMDASGGTIGSTQKTSTWLGFDLALETGWMPVYSGDGNLYFTFLKNTGPKLTGSITFEYDTTGVAAEDIYAAGTTYLIRQAFDGSATGFTGTGGTYSARKFIIDVAAKIVSIDVLDSRDGNDIVKVNWQAVYNATWGKFAEFTICNLLSSVP